MIIVYTSTSVVVVAKVGKLLALMDKFEAQQVRGVGACRPAHGGGGEGEDGVILYGRNRDNY
jgi:hypothetical protein